MTHRVIIICVFCLNVFRHIMYIDGISHLLVEEVGVQWVMCPIQYAE